MTSLMPELGYIVDAGGGTQAGLTLRMQCEILRAQLELERSTFLAHWKELSSYILPRRTRFFITDVNKGDRRNQNIIDSTATEAAGVLSAGMMAGLTSPARPWFQLTVPDPELAEQEDAKEWLHQVQRLMEAVFLRSNLYNKLPILYQDIAVFGTGAMAVLEDDETVIRCFDLPIGSYSLANDDKLRVRTFVRSFRLMVGQVVERWGNIDPNTGQPDFMDDRKGSSSISFTTQNLWKRGTIAAWVDIVHVIRPNRAYDGNKINSKYKRYESLYYEIGAPNQPVDPAQYGLLAHEGFDEFPILAARWETNSEDVYGTNCPGMRALGDIRQLQLGEKRSAQAIEKMVNPPMIGPSALRQAKASTIPGDITYIDVRDGMQGFKPAYQITFDIEDLEKKQEQIRNRINEVFKKNLFLMLTTDDPKQMTAREVDERHEEKMLGMGPVLEQLNQDVHDPLIERTFAIMQRKGLIPPPPPSLENAQLRVVYVSIMAQAQKQISLASLDKFSGYVGQVSQFDPTALDMVNVDELVTQYADATGVPPKVVRSEDQVTALRQEKAKQAAQQQAAQNIPAMAGAAKDLAATPTGGNTALSALLGKQQARATLGAAAAPPPSVFQ